jgi:hypothetical protein
MNAGIVRQIEMIQEFCASARKAEHQQKKSADENGDDYPQ